MRLLNVLLVDDEDESRRSFVDQFGEEFNITTSVDGKQAIEALQEEPKIVVVLIKVRVPTMNGIELIRAAKDIDSDAAFIVMGQHAEPENVVAALRAGARNFIVMPFSPSVLEAAIRTEARQILRLREERTKYERRQAVDRFAVSAERLFFSIPNDLSWVNPLAYRLVNLTAGTGLFGESSQMNLVLSLVEMLTNAIEHGNLGVDRAEKIRLKERGEAIYRDRLIKLAGMEPYQSRRVNVLMDFNESQASFTVQDEGDGFDTQKLPSPNDAEIQIGLKGLGILLTRSFLDDVRYNDRGNEVTLIKYRDPTSPDKGQDTTR